jgi:hypothetical protein
MTKQRHSLHDQYRMFTEACRVSHNRLREAENVKDSAYWLELYRSNLKMKLLTLHKICSG